jgi:RIO kinase 1
MSSDLLIDDKWLKKIDIQIKDLIDRIGIDRKTLDEVFDKSTLLLLGKLISNEVIEYLDFPISTGKEANIFRGVTPEKKFVAIKIFRTSTSTFKHITKYITGDPRFDCTNKTRRGIIFEWAKKEYKNLERANKVGVRVPKPIMKINNIVIMEYIGDEKNPAPQMKNVKLKNPKKFFNEIINYLITMYKKADLVHADLSPYNILVFKNKPIVIDFGQAVLLEHPSANDFLKRDIHNIVNYFNKLGLKIYEDEIFKSLNKSSD